MTLLRRLGNKQRIAHKIIPYFPAHRSFVDMFFGSGSILFAKPRVQYNFCNDLDNNVYNLFQVVKNRKDELVDYIIKTPIHQTLFKEWVKNEETDELWKAVRFLFLSNFSVLGKSDTLIFRQVNSKKTLLKEIDKGFENIQDIQFMNVDFRKVINQINFIQDGRNDESTTFIYADPPYLGTTSNYNLPWTKNDTQDLIEICKTTDIKMAISEFNNPEVMEMAEGLNIIPIAERQTLKNRNTEILITNYENEVTLFK